jgi:hypothetical protein
MALVVNINGVPKGVRGLTVNASQGQQGRVAATLVSIDGTDRPVIDDVIDVTDAGTLIFGGTIKMPTLSGHGSGGDVAEGPVIATAFTGLDFNELADRQMFTGTLPAGKLKAQATLLLAYLPGVTLGMVVDGPDMPEQYYEDAYISDILADRATRSGWLWEINYTKQLFFFQAGTRTAPWNVTDGDGNTYGDMTIARTRLNYANRITVKYTRTAVVARATLFSVGYNFVNGNTVTVGGKTYTFQTILTNVDGNVHLGANLGESLDALHRAITLGTGSGSDYAVVTIANGQISAARTGIGDPTYGGLQAIALIAGVGGNSIACSTVSTHGSWGDDWGTPTAALIGGADAALTNRVTVNDLTEQGLYGVYAAVVEAANVTDDASALSLAQDIILTAIIVQETIKYQTLRAGLLVGHTQSVGCANRWAGTKSCLIVGLDQTWWEGTIMQRTVTLIVGDNYKGSPMHQQYQRWQGSSVTQAVIGGGSGGGSGTTQVITGTALIGIINGVNQTFTLSTAFAPGSLRINWNGLALVEGGAADYTLSGLTVTLAIAPRSGDVLTADYAQ